MFVLYLHAAATLYMTGLIWFVQLVHYPLFIFAKGADYPRFQREHMRRTGWAVGLPMLVEAACALWLLWRRPAGLELVSVGIGASLLAVIWILTAFVQARQHGRLRTGFEPGLHQALTWWNWPRTILWSARSCLALWYLGEAAG